MLVLLHGEAGGWDELLIALVAFGVLWLAVKLAGRKSAGADEDEPTAGGEPAAATAAPAASAGGEATDVAEPPAKRHG